MSIAGQSIPRRAILRGGATPKLKQLAAASGATDHTEFLIAVLEESDSVSDAARRLGVTRQTLYQWIDRYGIEVIS